MQDKDENRVIVNLDEVILFMVFGIGLFCIIISLLCITNEWQNVWFLSTIVLLFIGAVLMIWISIATYTCIIVDNDKITVKQYNGKYLCLFSHMDYIEHRRTAIGKEAIFIHMREPMHFYSRERLIIKKDRINYPLPKSKRIINFLKQYIPKEIPWVYNDYYKNPNLEPKKPKKK